MMSPGVIHDMDLKAARKAAREKRVPLVLEAEDIEILKTQWPSGVLEKEGKCLQFPFLGTYIPRGWKRTGREFFVDSSGFGGPGEPALTFERFLEQVKPSHGYAITEAGQFQVYVAEYTPPRAR